MNPIAVIDKIDTSDRLVLPIGVILIEIGFDVGTLIRLEVHLLFRLHDLRSYQKLNLLYVEG